MNRTIATPPESVSTLCLVRFGLIARRWSGRGLVKRLMAQVEMSASRAIAEGAGLLRSETFAMGNNHRGVIQYWRDFAALETWSRQTPHVAWWRAAVERMRRRGDIGVYHEAFQVPRVGIESIYLDCPTLGLAS